VKRSLKLPHREPLLFAKEVIAQNDATATVRCIFPETPTLPMMMEAAAQSSGAFALVGEEKMGFLIKAQGLKLHRPLQEKSYLVTVACSAEIGEVKKFFFEAAGEQESLKAVSGYVTILLPSDK